MCIYYYYDIYSSYIMSSSNVYGKKFLFKIINNLFSGGTNI